MYSMVHGTKLKLRKRKARESAVPSPDLDSPDPLFRTQIPIMTLPDTYIIRLFYPRKVAR